MKKRVVLIISGRGSNMEAILRQTRTGILHDVCDIVLVFSNRPDAKGMAIAQSYGIKTACIASKGNKREVFDRKVLDFLAPYHADYLVLAGYMRLMSPVFIRAYPQRIINIHPADTRDFQGVGGYTWAFEQKLKKTYITVHYIDEGIDTGDIIEQRELDLRGMTTLEEIEKQGLALEHKMYSEVLKKVFENKK